MQAAPHQLSVSGQVAPCFCDFKKPDPACSQTDRHLICARKPINIDCCALRLPGAWLLLCSHRGCLLPVFPYFPPDTPEPEGSIPCSQMSLIVPKRWRPPVVQGISTLPAESQCCPPSFRLRSICLEWTLQRRPWAGRQPLVPFLPLTTALLFI